MATIEAAAGLIFLAADPGAAVASGVGGRTRRSASPTGSRSCAGITAGRLRAIVG
jgi:hypothetical protein